MKKTTILITVCLCNVVMAMACNNTERVSQKITTVDLKPPTVETMKNASGKPFIIVSRRPVSGSIPEYYAVLVKGDRSETFVVLVPIEKNGSLLLMDFLQPGREITVSRINFHADLEYSNYMYLGTPIFNQKL